MLLGATSETIAVVSVVVSASVAVLVVLIQTVASYLQQRRHAQEMRSLASEEREQSRKAQAYLDAMEHVEMLEGWVRQIIVAAETASDLDPEDAQTSDLVESLSQLQVNVSAQRVRAQLALHGSTAVCEAHREYLDTVQRVVGAGLIPTSSPQRAVMERQSYWRGTEDVDLGLVKRTALEATLRASIVEELMAAKLQGRPPEIADRSDSEGVRVKASGEQV